MSKIVYKPHCEQCGSLIEQNIQFKRITLQVGDSTRWLYNSTLDYEFNPFQCKICGAVFDSAEVQLPEEVEYFLSEGESE